MNTDKITSLTVFINKKNRMIYISIEDYKSQISQI